MYIRQINKDGKRPNTTMWIIIGLIAGLAVAAASYRIFNLSWGTPLGTSPYDTGVNDGNIPSIGDYLFGDASGELLTGFSNSGTTVTTTGIVYTGSNPDNNPALYPTGYVEQFNKAALILQNDALVNTYIDTDNLSMSGYSNISINSIPNTVVSPKVLLQGRVSQNIENLYILGSNSNGAYLFEPINYDDNTWAFQLDPNNNSIKPGVNNYYIIGKTQDSRYNIQYTTVRTYESGDYFAVLDKICLLDLCSDPALTKRFVPNSTTILQQSADNKTVIQIIPNVSIIKGTKCTNGAVAYQQVKRVGENYLKLTKGCNYESEGVTQSFVDAKNTPVSASNALANVPNVIQFGNIKYTPTLTINKNTKNFTKLTQVNNKFVTDDMLQKRVIVNEYAVELPDNVFVLYTLDKTQLNYMRPSNTNGSYKIIPKVVGRMNKNIVYTVPSSDIGLHDDIIAYFKGTVISNSNNCANPKPNKEPLAKFGIRPIDGNYDVVGFWNCYEAK